MPAWPSYPHMSSAESRVWHTFRQQVYIPPGALYYDARVGNPIPAEPGADPWVSRVRNVTSRKRLDAVLDTGTAWWLFEVKVRAGLSAVGQCIGYEYLFSASIAGEKPVMVVIVCESILRDLDLICEREGIGLYVSGRKPTFQWIAPALAGVFPGL